MSIGDKLEERLDGRKNTLVLLEILLAVIFAILPYSGYQYSKGEEGAKQFNEGITAQITEIQTKYKQEWTNDFPVHFEFRNENFDLIIDSISFSFPSGECHFEKTKAGWIAFKSIENRIVEFSQKLKTNQHPAIKIVTYGTADGNIPNNRKYDGENTHYIKYRNSDDTEKKPLYKQYINGETEMGNLDYALLRAYYFVDALKKDFPFIQDNDIEIFVKEYKQKGEEFRRCDFSMVLTNFFLNDYNELNWWAKQFLP
jgi:hypothetical protein